MQDVLGLLIHLWWRWRERENYPDALFLCPRFYWFISNELRFNWGLNVQCSWTSNSSFKVFILGISRKNSFFWTQEVWSFESRSKTLSLSIREFIFLFVCRVELRWDLAEPIFKSICLWLGVGLTPPRKDLNTGLSIALLTRISFQSSLWVLNLSLFLTTLLIGIIEGFARESQVLGIIFASLDSSDPNVVIYMLDFDYPLLKIVSKTWTSFIAGSLSVKSLLLRISSR